MIYGYDDLIRDKESFRKLGARVFSIGETGCGRDLIAVEILARHSSPTLQTETNTNLTSRGRICSTRNPLGFPECLIPASYGSLPFSPYSISTHQSPSPETIIVTGGIHAREHISSYFLVEIIKHFLKTGTNFKNNVVFIPMMNPDGIEIIKNGIASVPKKFREQLRKATKNENLQLLKSNAFLVDLNVNFDAKWGSGKSNVFECGLENFIGKAPFSENETSALRNFTLQAKPSMTFSYHAKGKELYWEFGQSGNTRKRDLKLAKKINRHLKYQMLFDDKTSAGGYKDWCIEKLRIPSFTIELVDDKFNHPLTDYRVVEDEFWRHIKMMRRVF